MGILLDNDVILKGACYGLLDQLFSSLSTDTRRMLVLGAARFVIAKRLQKKGFCSRIEEALHNLNGFMTAVSVIEPSEAEQTMAANLELLAQRRAVALDAGESQLCAVFISRGASSIVTGDKRAMEAIEQLLSVDPRLSPLCGNVYCLEQMMIRVADQRGFGYARAMICAEPGVDKSLTNSFSCSADEMPDESFLEGLNSYISDLRSRAPRVLAL